ncbi:hypothetical protein EDB84DRAFT_1265473 [Lactarius hengduanensis]|nr:hypothetical protein EDB84DRAFT_1265473 [Lactarius hengduanensis]
MFPVKRRGACCASYARKYIFIRFGFFFHCADTFHRQGVGCPKQEKVLTNEHSTLRRHAAAVHPRRYRKWCESNNFDSMLPEDSKKRKRIEKDRQSLVIDHFGPEDPTMRPIPFSEKALQTAALEWVIETNQPIQVFKNAAFKKMLNIASRANCSIRLPSPKQSRREIIKMFKQQLCSLQGHLNVTFFVFCFRIH